MNKSLLLLWIATLGLFQTGLWAQDETASTDTSAISQADASAIPAPQITPENLTFEFENHKHSLTLLPYETGKTTVKWDGFSGNGPLMAIKLREKGKNNWEVSHVFDPKDKEILLDSLPQNTIYEFVLGSGNDQKSIVYDTKTHHFHTISSFVFANNMSKGIEEGVKLNWAVPYDQLKAYLQIYPNTSYSIKYNTKIGAEQHKNDSTKSPWTKIDDISISTVNYTIKELDGGANYVYKIGLHLGHETIWSEKASFKTERTWGVFKLLMLIGALGMFIFGMKIMSEGLQKAAGSRLRNMLGSITSNRIKGIFTGFGITSIVQSSSVTTVMTVSFVNAGLLTLRQSAGVMMGANIGTTLTAWLILFFGFKVSLSDYALIFIAFGAPLMFFSKGKAKTWASVIIGFSLLFMGLGFLKETVPSLGPESPLVQFFIDYKNAWYGPVMFVGLGALVTVVIQSSSAAMALTMTLVAGNVIPFEVASAMILGENIGTTITAEIASLIGNVHAKRSARIHSLFNVIGVTWAILLFPFILRGIAMIIDGDPYTDGSSANTALAIFHSAFNALNVVILLPFVPWLVRMAEKTVKSKGSEDEEFHLDYIGSGIMGTPDLSIFEAKKEVAKFGEITSRMSGFAQQLMKEQNKKVKGKLHEKIAKYEEITDRVEVEVATYLAKVSEGEMSEQTAERIRSMNSIVNDLERIGDIFYQISKTLERKDEEKIWFIPEQRDSLLEMFGLIDKAFGIMIDNLNNDWSNVELDEANNMEGEINAKRDKMRAAHLANFGKKDFNMKSSMIYNNLFSSCEKVGDHIINVSEAITGRI